MRKRTMFTGERMNSTALIASDDLILRGEARSVLKEMQIASTCSGTIGFDKAVASTKFEAILLDIPDTDAALAAIRSVRSGKLNRYSIILSFVTDGQNASAGWAAGANFTIRRSRDLRNDLNKALQSAHGLMLREKRRYYRQSLSIHVEVRSNNRHFKARMLDISERGACIESTIPLPNQPLEVRFSLPGLAQALTIQAVPAWMRGAKIGIQFTLLDEVSKTALSQWLRTQIGPEVAENLADGARPL
jgi:hypothetical protein